MFRLEAKNDHHHHQFRDAAAAAAEGDQRPAASGCASPRPASKRRYFCHTKPVSIPLILTVTIIALQQTSNFNHNVKCHKLELSHEQTQTSAPLLARNLVHQAEAPDFTEPIGNQTVPVGRDAQLSCKIGNLGAYRTAWLRVEDKGILTIHTNVITRNYRFGLINDENERNFVLTIKNVQPSDKGGYMCQINSVPMKSSVGYLDVLTPPVFEDATTAPSPSVSGELGVTTGAPDESLAPSSSSSSSSSSSTNSSQTTVAEGASATLTCRASGHPMPSITWRREDGRPILLGGLADPADADGGAPTEIKDTTTLTFRTASRLNSGAYLCIASNGVQPSASKRQLLDVQFAPVITLPSTEIAARLDQREAHLECLVELNPLGSYHWIKLATSTINTDRRPMAVNQEDDLWLIGHDELIQSDKFDIVIRQINSEKVHMTLTIRRVERHDFSWYKCIAKNQLGLQSNFIRFYESTVPANTLASATTAGPPSSSFSFNSIFRGGSGGGGTQSDQLAQNDESAARQMAAAGGAGASHQPRAHSRSSWNQRSTGSMASSRSSASKLTPGSDGASGHLLALINLLIMFLRGADNCHPIIMPSYLISIAATAAVPIITVGALLTRSAQQITLRPT